MWRLRVLAFQRSVLYVTQGWMDQVDNFVCRNSIQEPSLLFWHCVMGCFGHACVVRLLHTVIGGLIISPTEEIGIPVMVTNKWGQVCPVDSLHQACGADICRMATSSLASVLLKSHRLLGLTLWLCSACQGERQVLLDPPASHRLSELSLMCRCAFPYTNSASFFLSVNWKRLGWG